MSLKKKILIEFSARLFLLLKLFTIVKICLTKFYTSLTGIENFLSSFHINRINTLFKKHLIFQIFYEMNRIILFFSSYMSDKFYSCVTYIELKGGAFPLINVLYNETIT